LFPLFCWIDQYITCKSRSNVGSKVSQEVDFWKFSYCSPKMGFAKALMTPRVSASWAESIGVLQVRIGWKGEKLFNSVFLLEIPFGGVFAQKVTPRPTFWQKPYMLTVCGRVPFDRLMMSFGLSWVHPNEMNCVEFGFGRSRGFGSARGQFWPIAIDRPTRPYNIASTTVQQVIVHLINFDILLIYCWYCATAYKL
jgi:hypothetical protein